MEGFEALAEAVETALANYRDAIEKLVIKTLKDFAAKDPEAEYKYIAGMGTWRFTRKGPEIEEGETQTFVVERDIEPEPTFSAIVDAESQYGNSVVPDGTFTAKGKEFTRR